MSLRHFFSFLLSVKSEEVKCNLNDVKAAREKVCLWSTSYKRDSCTRRWKKLEEDAVNRLSAADIKKFEKSKAAREAIKLIGQFSDPSKTPLVTQTMYTLVRDFLFTQIFIDNANRPGVLSCMTMDEFHNMREEGEGNIIAVMKHKTVHIHGPAYIVLSKKLKSWLTVFAEVIRSQVATSTTGPVFLSWNGQSMESGQINKALKSVFKKAEITTNVTSTSFRKAAVTKMHESNPELSGKLAGLMAHNEVTAKKYYLLAEKSKASVEASKKLAKLMRDEDDTQSSTAGSEVNAKSDECQDGKRIYWNSQDLQKIKECFKEEIKQRWVTIHAVRAKVKGNKELQGMSVRRIYFKLKKIVSQEQGDVAADVNCEPPKESESLYEKLKRSFPDTELTESSTHDQCSSVSIFTPTERSTGIFSDADVAGVKSLFADMILQNKPISKVEIKKRCSETKEGKVLSSKLSVIQLVNRIKYERKKTKS